MALSLNDVLAQRQARRAAKVTALETHIDEFLVDFLDADTCVVDVDNTVPPSIFNEVVSTYRNLLWHVDVQTDFRGNRQLVFTTPSP